MSVLGPFWLFLSSLQLTGAAYVVAAVTTWRGERFWRAPGRPLGLVATGLGFVVVAAGIAAMLVVNDVEFARFVGSGALMLAAVSSVFLLLRRS
jgi:predicted signal transduction protein with EAL and GGDEF domain